MAQSYEQSISYIVNKSGDNYPTLKNFLATNSIAIFLLTKKLVGKSIYIHHLQTLFPNEFQIISVGDIVRGVQAEISEELKNDIRTTLKNQGNIGEFTQFEQILDSIKTSTVKKLLPSSITEFLIRREIVKIPNNKSIIFDGLPRAIDQIPFVNTIITELQNNTNRKSLLIEIDLNDEILDARQTARRICPACGLNSNIMTVVGGTPKFDKNTQEFYLECDSPTCKNKAIKLEVKAGETDYESMIIRRRQEEVVNKKMRENANEKYIYLRSDVLVDDFKKDKETMNIELNQVTKFSLDKNESVTLEQVAQIGHIDGLPAQAGVQAEAGKPAYSLAPAGFLPILINKIVKKI